MGDRWVAPEEEMATRRDLCGYVSTELPRHEREFGISGFADDDRFQIFSYAPTVVKKLLRHRYARIDWIYVMPDDGRGYEVEDLSTFEIRHGSENVEGIQATMPVGTLGVKGVPRSDDHLSSVIKTPEESEAVSLG